MNTEIFEMYRRPDFLVVPELVSLGLFVTSESRLGGVREDGTGGLEIGYLEHGTVEWWNGEALEEAGPGSVLIDHPGDWQGGASAIVHPCTRYWLRFDFPDNSNLPGLETSTTLSMKQSYATMERRHFPGSQVVRNLFLGLLNQQRDPDDFSEDFGRSLFHQILISVLRDHERNKQQQVSKTIRAALRYLSNNLGNEIHVADVAREVDLSTGYFHDVFLRETGITPSRYHLNMRIAAAKQALIATDRSVTDIAIDLGFSSSQYFATTFKKVVGLTPMQYKKLRAG